MVICLECGADLHMAQLMPLPLTVSCFSKIQIGFTFMVPAHPGSPRKRAVKRVCVCVKYLSVYRVLLLVECGWVWLVVCQCGRVQPCLVLSKPLPDWLEARVADMANELDLRVKVLSTASFHRHTW